MRLELSSFKKETGGIGNQWKNQDYPDHSIVKISLNVKKSPGNPGRLAVTQTPVKIGVKEYKQRKSLKAPL